MTARVTRSRTAEARRPRRAGAFGPADPDLVTKERLLEAGTRLFAERGFAKVTVRDICARAKANVAAINYHFGGKTGLYEAVLHVAMGAMQKVTEESRREGDGRPPEEQLGIFVRVLLQRFYEGRNSWIHQLMMHELADPTPALNLVIDQVILPRTAYLAGIVSSLLGCPADDERVRLSVASVQAQCLGVMRKPIAPRLGYGPIAQEDIPLLARHITAFSVAGIRGV